MIQLLDFLNWEFFGEIEALVDNLVKYFRWIWCGGHHGEPT